MEIQAYSLNEWKKLFPNNYYTLFEEPDFLELISNSYDKSLKYYTVVDKGNYLLSVPMLFNEKDASLVTHFFYQTIIKHSDFSERKFLQIWDLLIVRLKNDFNVIEFKLPTYVEDIRPLQWTGFGHNVYYTYVIDCKKENNYSNNVIRAIKKAESSKLKVDNSEFSKEILEEQLLDMQKNGLSNNESNKLRFWINKLSDQGRTRFLALVNENENRIGSAIFLYDSEQAYLLCIMGGDEKMGGQALIYDQAIKYFRENGLNKIDLLGANIPSVAVYKSKFGAELQSYTIVSYRKFYFGHSVLTLSKNTLKYLLKSLRFINK